jgi:hypothetical protein
MPDLPRYDKKRRLERAGFVFLSGWVRAEDAPRLRKAIARGEEQAAEALAAPDTCAPART